MISEDDVDVQMRYGEIDNGRWAVEVHTSKGNWSFVGTKEEVEEKYNLLKIVLHEMLVDVKFGIPSTRDRTDRILHDAREEYEKKNRTNINSA